MAGPRFPVPAGGGLRLPKTVGMEAPAQQAIHNKWTTSPVVEQEVAAAGLPYDETPPCAYPGTLTAEQLTTIDPSEYTQLYSEHLGWYNYLAPIVARIKSHLLEVRNEKKEIDVHISTGERKRNTVRAKGDKLTAGEIEDAVWMDPRYNELVIIEQKLEQQKLEFEARLDCVHRNLQVLSRQVTLKGQELELNRMENNLPTRKTPERWNGVGR